MQSLIASTVGAVWSHRPATRTAIASTDSLGNTVRMNRGVNGSAKMEEPASKTHPTQTSTAAVVPCNSLGDTVSTNYLNHAPQPAPIRSVSCSQGTECVMKSVTTMNASGMEVTARSTGNSLGLTALPVSPAGISLRTDAVTRSATMLAASLTALSARIPQ